MQIGAADVEVALAASGKENGRAGVDENADGGHRHHGSRRHGLRVRQALDRLPAQAADGQQQQDRVEQRRQNGRTAQAIGEPGARRPLAEVVGEPGDGEAKHIAEIVPGVRKQGHRVCEIAIERLDAHEPGVEGDADQEGAPEIGGGVGMAVAVRMSRMVVITVMIVVVVVLVIVHGQGLGVAPGLRLKRTLGKSMFPSNAMGCCRVCGG